MDLSTCGDGGGGVQSNIINEKRGVYVQTSPTIVDLVTARNKRAPKNRAKRPNVATMRRLWSKRSNNKLSAIFERSV